MAKQVYGYQTFAGFVNAIRNLDMTSSRWEELSEEEQAEITEIAGQICNSVSELKRINPKRWENPSV